VIAHIGALPLERGAAGPDRRRQRAAGGVRDRPQTPLLPDVPLRRTGVIVAEA
jgi:hypothetical protein